MPPAMNGGDAASLEAVHSHHWRYSMEAVVRRLSAEDGMSTAEYAIGTVAACGFGGVLVKLLSSPDVQQLLGQVIEKAFSFIL